MVAATACLYGTVVVLLRDSSVFMHTGACTIYNITLQTFNWSIILKILDNVIFLAWKLLISDNYFGSQKTLLKINNFQKQKTWISNLYLIRYLMGIIMNWTYHSKKKGSLDITFNSPFHKYISEATLGFKAFKTFFSQTCL